MGECKNFSRGDKKNPKYFGLPVFEWFKIQTHFGGVLDRTNVPKTIKKYPKTVFKEPKVTKNSIKFNNLKAMVGAKAPSPLQVPTISWKKARPYAAIPANPPPLSVDFFDPKSSPDTIEIVATIEFRTRILSMNLLYIDLDQNLDDFVVFIVVFDINWLLINFYNLLIDFFDL